MSAGEARTKREGLRVAFIERTSEEALGRSKCSVLEANDDAGKAHPIVQLRRAMQANCSVETRTDFSTPQSSVETEVDKLVLRLSRENVNCVLEMLMLKTLDDHRSKIQRLKERLVG
ncbi:hypothetical protein TSAR_004301 [Trichomalopsis sarcophagae]|uniref:Uncharacterized protein n=1 Tax=Trichomalopsis sarcophagae TaxID=543379 RepID=A0A232F6R0_9HYME|nr:hypothetical protein TSAR_004301 [Trichomalopsis sarcophagae]